MKAKLYFILNLVLFLISLIAVVWYLGGGVLVAFDDFSHFFYDFSRYFEYFSFNILIPNLVSLLFASFFGFNILKVVRDSDHLRKKRFKLLLPIMGVIVTILSILFLIVYGLVFSKLNPANAEVGIGVAFGIISLCLGGFILTVVFGISGFFIDKNIISFIRFLKILMLLFLIVIIVSILVVAINFSSKGCLSSDNKCLLEKAIAEEDPKICDKSDWCYMKYYETQDSSVCFSMPNKVDTIGGGVIFYNFRDDCYEHFASKGGNTTLCELIQNEVRRDYCIKRWSTETKK